MKVSFLFVIVVFELNSKILARPPSGGVGDGYIYQVKQTALKPKSTTTYYAKPLHPPMMKAHGSSKPKPEVFKVIIQNQPDFSAQPPSKEQIFKIIHLQKKQNNNNNGGGKSVKILKIMHLKQVKGSNSAGWAN